MKDVIGVGNEDQRAAAADTACGVTHHPGGHVNIARRVRRHTPAREVVKVKEGAGLKRRGFGKIRGKGDRDILEERATRGKDGERGDADALWGDGNAARQVDIASGRTARGENHGGTNRLRVEVEDQPHDKRKGGGDTGDKEVEKLAGGLGAIQGQIAISGLRYQDKREGLTGLNIVHVLRVDR